MRSNMSVARQSASGFSLLEVIISMFLTAVVMGAVYGLLLKGQQAFEREPDVVDLQQSARTALALVSADVLQAGTGLPPEFPAFTPITVDPTVGDGGTTNPDVIEIIGNLQDPDQPQQLPEQVSGFDGTTVTLASPQTNLRGPMNGQPGDLVVIYDDSAPDTPTWWFGDVVAVDAVNSRITVQPNATAQGKYNTPTSPGRGWITRVSVVRYAAGLQNAPGTPCIVAQNLAATNQTVDNPCVLRRSVNFGNPLPVGTVFDFQVTYFIDADGDSVVDSGETQVDPVAPTPGTVAIPPATVPPIATSIISNVNVQIAARSVASNEFIEKSFSTMVNPRNITSGVGVRTKDAANGPAYQ